MSFIDYSIFAVYMLGVLGIGLSAVMFVFI
jgi:hypothetical protein